MAPAISAVKINTTPCRVMVLRDRNMQWHQLPSEAPEIEPRPEHAPRQLGTTATSPLRHSDYHSASAHGQNRCNQPDSSSPTRQENDGQSLSTRHRSASGEVTATTSPSRLQKSLASTPRSSGMAVSFSCVTASREPAPSSTMIRSRSIGSPAKTVSAWARTSRSSLRLMRASGTKRTRPRPARPPSPIFVRRPCYSRGCVPSPARVFWTTGSSV